MRLIVLACVAAVALARPEKLPLRVVSRRRQPVRQPVYVEPQQFQQPSHFDQQQVQQPSHFAQQQFQQPSHSVQQQFSPVEEQEPTQQRPLSKERLRDRDAVITSFTSERNDNGASHAYTADNGLERQETIQLREVVSVDEDGREVVTTVPVVSGKFQFLLDDGTVVTRSYTTDERGHLVWQGTDLPQAPAPEPAPVYQ